MATKPVTTPQIWATNALYTTGPFIGQPSKVVPGAAVAAEGHRPGALYPTPAEYENQQQNQITTWIVNWLYLGSSAGAANAHIVETNSAGRATLHGLNVNDTVDETAVNITGVNTLAPTVIVSCTTGATAVQADIGNSTGTGFSASVGTGAGVGVDVAMVGTALGGFGINVTADAASNANAVSVTQAGDGYGITVTGGPTVEAVHAVGGTAQAAGVFTASGGATAALVGQNATGGTAGVLGLGTGSTPGGDFTGGNTAAHGARGTGGSATAYGLHGRTANAGGSSSAGVFGEGRGTGSMGVYGRSDDGIGVVAQSDLTSPGYPAMRIVPQDDDPASYTDNGAVLWSSTMRQIRHSVASFGYRSVLTYGYGSAIHAISTFSVGATQTDNSGVLTNALTVQVLEGDGNGFFGSGVGVSVYIKFSCDVRTSGAADYLQLEINDITSGTTLVAAWTGSGSGAQAAFYCGQATSNWQRSVVVVVPYAPAADGDLIIEANIARLTSTITIRNARLEICGTFP